MKVIIKNVLIDGYNVGKSFLVLKNEKGYFGKKNTSISIFHVVSFANLFLKKLFFMIDIEQKKELK